MAKIQDGRPRPSSIAGPGPASESLCKPRKPCKPRKRSDTAPHARAQYRTISSVRCST
eukprot:CAMPEP_0180063508 /NCGR_PEP_ID=MMETSP0985-20121206/7677_1 /TAXON_ID=483367 /ORGANISM="non described non described, Strain CCMP 2436" /LENGTH=57 /DNA_ID=CAMNT_0021993731 /DNA_START=123 /DNA_END=292 /DNA_ORIENTATION=-